MSRWPYMIPPAQIVSPTHWSTPYFSGNADVVCKGLEPADADTADDVARALERRAPLGGRGDLGRQAGSPRRCGG